MKTQVVLKMLERRSQQLLRPVPQGAEGAFPLPVQPQHHRHLETRCSLGLGRASLGRPGASQSGLLPASHRGLQPEAWSGAHSRPGTPVRTLCSRELCCTPQPRSVPSLLLSIGLLSPGPRGRFCPSCSARLPARSRSQGHGSACFQHHLPLEAFVVSLFGS